MMREERGRQPKKSGPRTMTKCNANSQWDFTMQAQGQHATTCRNDKVKKTCCHHKQGASTWAFRCHSSSNGQCPIQRWGVHSRWQINVQRDQNAATTEFSERESLQCEKFSYLTLVCNLTENAGSWSNVFSQKQHAR